VLLDINTKKSSSSALLSGTRILTQLESTSIKNFILLLFQPTKRGRKDYFILQFVSLLELKKIKIDSLKTFGTLR